MLSGACKPMFFFKKKMGLQVDGAGAINSVLSPAANPDPCKAETGKGDQSDWGAIRDPATEKAVGGDAIAARAVGGSDSVQLQL